MSYNEVQDDQVIEEMISLPEADVVNDTPPAAAKKGLSPTFKVAALGGGLVLVFAGAMMLGSGNTPDQASSTRAPGRIDSTPGGDIQANSPQYQENLRVMNEQRATRATELGVTSLPTPEVIMGPAAPIENIGNITAEPKVEEKPTETKQPVQVSEPRRIPRPPAPVVQPQPAFAQNHQAQPVAAAPGSAPAKEPENPYIQRMNGMMGKAVTSFAPKPMTTENFDLAEVAVDPASAGNTGSVTGVTGATGDSAAADGTLAPGEMLLRPGDVLYAETMTSVNSDLPSPVMAEVVHGPHKGARLVGSFTSDPASARMVVTFATMTFADGRVVDINGVAVDGKSAETAVASDVERRYVARYAPILAATFINGYAQAKAQPKQTVVGTGDNAQVVTEQSTSETAIASGLAAASAAVATDIAANAPKGPKIILQQGWPIGVLITAPVTIAEPAAAQPANKAFTADFVPHPGSASRLPQGGPPVQVGQ
ncbi:DotG/IcmE/VirB10 family protein [Paracoccus litorisediminis]|uniref:DotG/IcmE/VirB10 family protein n=1 Tax=Paracoccus litorisediminis TaxID=2006130 RepID=UPI0037304038